MDLAQLIKENWVAEKGGNAEQQNKNATKPGTYPGLSKGSNSMGYALSKPAYRTKTVTENARNAKGEIGFRRLFNCLVHVMRRRKELFDVAKIWESDGVLFLSSLLRLAESV